MHSPHSPLLTDETTNHHLKKNKLSARYINNTSFLCNIATDHSKLGTENSSTSQKSTSTISSSKLICYCEKRGKEESLEGSNNKISIDSGVAKRLVPTRNAATSPHLDIRKLGSMTTLNPSPSLTNELFVKSTETAEYKKKNKLKIQNRNILKIDDEANPKKILEKANFIGESKPLKLLRTTRSLSPRPPIRHQHAMLVSDSKNVDIQFSRLSNTKARTNKQQINKLCRSEQSSPNVIDGTEIQFSYNESTNRSTGCLGNVFADPWLKITGCDNVSSSLLSTVKKEMRFHQGNTVVENNKDPWVKRADIDSSSKVSRHDLFRQSKSFSTSRFDVETIINPSLSSSAKTPGYLKEDTKSTSIIDVKKQLRSAPSSPQFLTASENIFSSSTYLTNQHSTGSFSDKTPIRSSSFSPARIKDSHNPFTDYNLHHSNSPQPSISVATEIIDDENKSKSKLNIRSTNYEFLNVCNPVFLNARHSFSSVSDQQQGDELQLNIRRLSDQMRRKESFYTNSIKTFSSDRNVRDNRIYENKVLTSANDTIMQSTRERVPINRADFSEYLEQFRCSEAKKAAISKEKPCQCRENNNSLTKTQNNQPIVINKTQQSSDCLLETTC